jgi:hypothetical protein
MTTRTMSAALAALALAAALIVWLAGAPAVSSPSVESPRAGPAEDVVVAGRQEWPVGIAADPQPMESSPVLDASVAEPGFTIAVTATRLLPTGATAPPGSVVLELGISSTRDDPGKPVIVFATGQDGTARIAFPRSSVPEPTEGKRPRLWLRSKGVRLLTRTAYEVVPEADDVTVAMSVVVQSGTIVEGRILGPDGQPAPGRVEWWYFGDEGITGSQVGIAGADGLFRGELHLEGRHGLLARGASRVSDSNASFYLPQHVDLGTGFSELFDVEFSRPVPFIEVRVSGPGVLRGRVLDDRGAPAAGVQMLAVLAELDDEAGSLRLPQPRAGDLERMGGGHLWVSAATDADGAFVFRGLRSGLFHLRAKDGDDSLSSGYPVLLTEHPVPSDGAPLELRLNRPYLAIHVREADGSVPAGAIQIHRHAFWMSTLDGWPAEPGLLVTLSPHGANLAGWRGAYLEAKSTGPGEFVAELDEHLRVAAALELDVGVLGGELPWRPQRAIVPPRSGRVDVNLVLPPAEPLGALLLDVVDASGAPLVKQVRIRIEDPVIGAVLVDVPCDYTDEKDWPMRIPLPHGEYRLLVEGHAWIDSHHGTIMERRVHGAHEQALPITAGSESRVTASLGQAARLALRVIGSVTEADREAIRAQYPRNGIEGHDEYTEYWAQLVTLQLEREGRWPESPQFARYAMEGTSAAGTHLFSSVAFNSDEISQPLTPGTFKLVATTAGGRVAEREVTLVPGQTLSVTLSFE